MRLFICCVLIGFCYTQTVMEQEMEEDNKYFVQLYNQRNHEEAFVIAQKNYDKAKKNLGLDHAQTIMTMNNLAIIYQHYGKYDEAGKLYATCVSFSEKQTGENKIIINYLNNLASLYTLQGKYIKAEKEQMRSLQLSRELLGDKNPNTIICMGNLAMLYTYTGKYQKAEPLALESLELCEETKGESHADTFTALNNLAFLYDEQGKYKQAETLYVKCLKIRQKILGINNAETLLSINNLALCYQNQGKYSEAEKLLQKCLSLREQKLGKDHPDTLASINGISSLYENQGKYAEAEELLQKCLSLREQKLGKDHPDTLVSMNNLALCYQSQGKYSEAEQLFSTGLEVCEKNLGKNHPLTLTHISHLASLYQIQGKLQKTEELLRKCIEASKEVLGVSHPDTLTYMSNLASLYDQKKEYQEAEKLYLECLEQKQKILGKDHPSNIILMNNLISVYKYQNKYMQCENLYLECLELSRQKLGENHPITIGIKSNLAVLYEEQKKYSLAESIYLECLNERKNILGESHPDVLVSMHNLASLYWFSKKYPEAQKLSMERIKTLHHHQYALLLTSDKKVQTHFLGKQKLPNDFYLSLNLQLNNQHSGHNFVLYSLLNKALLLSVSMQAQILKQNSSPEIQKILYELQQTKQTLSHSYIDTKLNQVSDLHMLEQSNYSQEIVNRLERELGLLSNQFRQITTPVTVEDIKESLEKDEVIIDFLVFDKLNIENRYKYEDRYITASIIKQDSIIFVPIGSFSKIETLLVELHLAITSKKNISLVKDISRKLYQLLWQPLEKFVNNYSTVIVVPDAELHTLPFAVLCDENGKYLMEKLHIETCSSLRDIIRPAENINNNNDIVIFAHPNYNKKMGGEPLFTELSSLPATQDESKALQELLQDKNIRYQAYHEDNATKENLLAVQNPQILHLATHGFFFSNLANENFSDDEARGIDMLAFRQQTISSQSKLTNLYNVDNNLFEPLAHCGLAFAGANMSSSQKTILLGSEISSLSLWKTELVVLSACETGLGTTKMTTSSGETYRTEEVFSLRRAFQEAGAKSVLSTMWKINDSATKEFMSTFYQYYLDKVPPQQAIRAVQYEFMQNSNYSHPYYWAGFVFVGIDKQFSNHTKHLNVELSKKHRTDWLLWISTSILVLIIVLCIFLIHRKKQFQIIDQRKKRRKKRRDI